MAKICTSSATYQSLISLLSSTLSLVLSHATLHVLFGSTGGYWIFFPTQGWQDGQHRGTEWAMSLNYVRAACSHSTSPHHSPKERRRKSVKRRNMATVLLFKLCNIHFCQSILDDKFTASLRLIVWTLLRESISRKTVKVRVNVITLHRQFLATCEWQRRPLSSNVLSRNIKNVLVMNKQLLIYAFSGRFYPKQNANWIYGKM